MIKKSRLRVQKPKKGRRVILYLLVILILGGIGYQLDRSFEIIPYIKEILVSFKASLSPKGPVRGTFYDRNLKQLAVTLERVSVYVRTREVDSITETTSRLSEIFVLSKELLKEQLESGVLRLWIAKDISREQEKMLKDLKLPGVYFQREEKRYYPGESHAAHIIGYVENGIGLSGVEFYYNQLLAGSQQKQKETKKNLGNRLDLVLTIDMKIQEILETLVRDIAVSEQADKVAAYLIESGTGEIIGGANLPEFNPNSFARYSQEQMENMFFVPFCLPEKYRLFVRDAIMLHSKDFDDVSPPAWSLVSENNDLGTQLRTWDWLGLEETLETDFYDAPQSKKISLAQQKPVTTSKSYFGFVPDTASPLNLLKSLSMLLGPGKIIHTFVVKKILDNDSLEGPQSPAEEKINVSSNRSPWHSNRVTSLFRSQAQQGVSNSFFLRDDIVVGVESGGYQRFYVNEMLFATIPSGKHELHMLIVAQRNPSGVSREKSRDSQSLEQLVEKKIERISVLQQVAKIVADVVEPETSEMDNYETPIPSPLVVPVERKKEVKKESIQDTMPNLRGLSLRKSLQMLQGQKLEIKIQGTGRVVDQTPQPGSSLKGVTNCVLILEKMENIVPGTYRKELHDSKQ